MLGTIIWFVLLSVCLASIPLIFIEIHKINKRMDEFDFEAEEEEEKEIICNLPEDIPCQAKGLYNQCKSANFEYCMYRNESAV